MVGPGLDSDAKDRAEECSAQFRHQLLKRIGMVPEAFAKFPVESLGAADPMRVMPISA